MIYWYRDLYMDEKVAKHPEHCKKQVEAKRLWKKSYVAVTLAVNEENLFEIMETRQLFFRRYANMDLYVVGLASSYQKAVEMLQKMMEKGYRSDPLFEPRKLFPKENFSTYKK